MQEHHDDATRRRFEAFLEAKKAGTRPGARGTDPRRATGGPRGRSAPASGARTFRRRKV